MRMFNARFAASGLILLMTACGAQPRVPPSAAATPAAPAIAWDGTYRGTVQITALGSGMQRRWCETDPQPQIQVTGSTLTYSMPHPNAPGNPTPVYTADVMPDGSFHSAIASGMMSGRITGGHMSGTIEGSACVYAFTMDRT